MAQGFFFSGEEGNLSGRKKLAELMFRQGMTQQNSRHWMEDAANAAKGILGAYQMSKADREQSLLDRSYMDAVTQGMGARPDTVTGSTGEAATAAPAATPAAAPARPASFSGGSQEFIQQMLPHAQRVAQQTGIDPRIVIAQAALESGWGRRAPGNNFFGIKSHGQPGGQTLATTEVVGGQPVRTRDSFRAYGSMGESADGYGQFLQQNPRYRPMLQARGLDAQIQALGASGYATDPNYAAKIRQIASGIQVPHAQPAPAAPDALEGGAGDGLAAPDLAGTFDTMRRAAPGPMDPRARTFDQISRAGMQPSQAVSPAPSMDSMMAGEQVTQPMQAPMPVPRPQIPEAPTALAQAPMQAPMPQPRPNIEPPPGAQPASARQQIAGMMGMNERDRLMMLRDEQSLAPGEADTLRAGLGGQPQAAPQAAPATPSANPIARLREMVMGGGSASPAAQTPAAAQSQPAASGDTRARLMQAIMNPNVSPTVRQGAMMALQQMQPDTQVITTPDGAIIAVDKRTGQVRNLREAARPPVSVGEGARLVDPQTGRVIAQGGEQRTPDQRNYEVYVGQERAAGRQPDDFTKWLRGNRRESSGLDTPDEAFQKTLGTEVAKQIGEIITDGRQADADLRNLNELERLLGQIGTGASAEAKRRLGDLGIQFEGTDRVQAASAILNRLTPQQRVPGSGATSDFDARMFRDSLPRLINTPEGNRLIIQSMREVAENRAARAEIASRMSLRPEDGGISRSEGLKQLRDLSTQARAISTRAAEAARSMGQTPAPRAGGVSEGATATNPQTGARVRFTNGQWVPVP